MKRWQLICAAVALMLASIWGGAYAVHLYPAPHSWQSLPIWITAMLGVGGSWALLAYAAVFIGEE